MIISEKLPWMDAAILELLRIQPVAPLGVFHRSTEDTTINGYDVPKNTLVISNIFAAHRDPKVWRNPEQFDPSRFINNEGEFVKSQLVIPFAVGKQMSKQISGIRNYTLILLSGRRACLGESLAQMELFLVFANILHKFDLEIPQGVTVSSKNVHVGVTMNPDPFQLLFKPRWR